MNNLLLLVNIYLLFLHSPDPRTVQWPPVALNNILCLCVMVNMDWGSPHIPRQMKKKLHWYAPPTTYQMQVPLFLWRVLSQLLNLPASGCECYGSGKKKSGPFAWLLHFIFAGVKVVDRTIVWLEQLNPDGLKSVISAPSVDVTSAHSLLYFSQSWNLFLHTCQFWIIKTWLRG